MIKITKTFITAITDEARRSKRQRQNYNFHKSSDEKIQRMINAMEPATYVRPHKHENPDKLESFIVLSGKLAAIEYDDKGSIVDYAILDANGECRGVEIPARTWHNFLSLEPASVMYELKEGPYDSVTDKTFPPWAPPEGHPDAQKFNRKILQQIVK